MYPLRVLFITVALLALWALPRKLEGSPITFKALLLSIYQWASKASNAGYLLLVLGIPSEATLKTWTDWGFFVTVVFIYKLKVEGVLNQLIQPKWNIATLSLMFLCALLLTDLTMPHEGVIPLVQLYGSN